MERLGQKWFLALVWVCGSGCASPPVVTEEPGSKEPDPEREALVAEDGGWQEDQTPAEDTSAEELGGESDRPDGEPTSLLGWIALYEKGGNVLFHGATQWFRGVGAFFSDQPGYDHMLPRHLSKLFAYSHREGACTLYNFDPTPHPEAIQPSPGEGCDPACRDTEWCVHVPPPREAWICVPLPQHWSAGTLEFSGLKRALTLELEKGRYALAEEPGDLFDAGNPITVKASGDELEAFQLSATGVSPLVTRQEIVSVRSGQPSLVRWTPAQPTEPEVRVELVLIGGWHDPNPPGPVVRCEVADAEGMIQVPADLVAPFLTGLIMKQSCLARYTRSTIRLSKGEVEFVVGSIRPLSIVVEQ